jgi:hypothetical protein
MSSSKGILLLTLIAIVSVIIYVASSPQTTVLPGTALSPAAITVFAPMPGGIQNLLPIAQPQDKREGFTVKFGKRQVPQTPMTRVQSVEVQTDCVPLPPPPQQVESVSVSYSHGVGRYQESARSSAQVVNSIADDVSGVKIIDKNPLMII